MQGRQLLAALSNLPSQRAAETAASAEPMPEIQMFVGESRVLPAPGVSRIAVGSGTLMSASAIGGKDVLLFANAPGTTTLFIWSGERLDQKLKVMITPGDTSRIAREIGAFVAAMPKVRTAIIGDRIVIEGDDLSDADLARIDALAKAYPQIVNFTNRQGWEQMVLLDVHVVEFPVKELREIGLKWTAAGGVAMAGIWSPVRIGSNGPYRLNIPSGAAGPPISHPDGESLPVVLPSKPNLLSGLNIGIGAQLDLLASQGRASILAQPQLSARNGSQATFLAGGELPYTVSTINGPTVLFKPYGIRLAITPQVSPSGTIRATIDSEVSSIDSSVSTPSGPALLTRQTKTEFNVLNGETIVLSGLISREQSKDMDKLPLLGDLPVIGHLFRSKRFRNQETELVVFVAPRVIDSRTPDLVDRVQRTQARLQDRFGPSPYLSEPLQPSPPRVMAVPDAVAAPPVMVPPPPAPEPVFIPSASGRYRVTAGRLTLRAKPNPDSGTLREINQGMRLQALNEKPVGIWLPVRFDYDNTIVDGWVDWRGLFAEDGRGG